MLLTMKKILLASAIGLLVINSTNARTCEETVYDICIRQERGNSDASRGGVSKEEFCKIVAISECTIGES